MHRDLGITARSATVGTCACGGAAGACACGHGHGAAVAPVAHSEGRTTLSVTGMTCEHCVASVTEELSAVDGVEDVAVDLRAGGVSTVTVTAVRPLADEALRAAVEEAGYTLAPA